MGEHDSGLPGVRSDVSATPRDILVTTMGKILLPRGRIIDGSESRDPLHTGYKDIIRAGTILGITAGHLLAPSFIGSVLADYTSGGTELTVSVAAALEIVRRVGTSGTLNLTHAPTPTGTVVPYATLTFSAVDTATGVLTISNIGANVETGALVGPPVASLEYVPRVILLDEYGVKVTNENGVDVDVQAKRLLVGGFLDTAKILEWPAAANTTLIAWLKGVLNANGQFLFSCNFIG